MKITKGAILSALLFLTSIATMAQNIKATVTQTGQTNPLETAVLSPGTDGLLCSFVDGKLVITKGTNETPHIAELPMKHGAAMEIQSTSESPNSRQVKLTKDGYATIYSAFQIDCRSLTDGVVTVYAPTLNNNQLILDGSRKVTTIIPVATGVIVHKTGVSESDQTVDIPYAVNTSPSIKDGNVLSGTILATPKAELGTGINFIYTLDHKNGNSAFFEYTPNDTKTCRAFLPRSSKIQAQAKGITFKFDDDPTGISDIEVESNTADGKCYNLSGQRVNSNTKGIVIIGGKKYINR